MNQLNLGGVLGNSLLLAALLALSHGILKWVAVNGGESLLETLGRHWLLVGLALAIYGFIFFYYLVVLQRFNLASLYSIYTGLAVLFVVVISVAFFQESLSRSQLLGCLFIATGVALVGRV